MCSNQWSARVVFSISRREWEFLWFNLVHRDETESSWHLLSGFETRPRVPDTYSRASRRDRDLLSSLSGIETRTRIPLIWSRFSRQDREFWNSPSFPEIRIERHHYFACNFWEANFIKWRAPHFARCARLTWITWLPCISSIAFIPCLICITFITWLSITSLNSLLIRIFKMYNLPIEANLWSDSKKKWLPCVSDFEAYWLASKWLRWKIDYLDTRAVIKYKIEATESGLVLISIKDILSKGSNSNISAFYSSPIYSSSSRSSKNKSRSFSIITLDIFSVEEAKTKILTILPSIWEISRLKHPLYALVYAAKGPFVLYKINNIIFENGKKNCTFLVGWLP